MTDKEQGGRSRPGGQLQAATTVAFNIAYTLYTAYFAGLVAMVVPSHTREAAFQLFCDLRANTPKDRRFLVRHARAFAPQTAPGWLAMAAALSYGLAGLLALSTLTLTLSVAGVYSALAMAAVAGVVLASFLGLLAICLLVSAGVTGLVATGALMSWAGISSALAVARLAARVLLGSPPAAAAAHEKQQLLPALARGLPTGEASMPAGDVDSQQQQEGQSSSVQPLPLPPIRTKSPRKIGADREHQAAGQSDGTAATASPASPRLAAAAQNHSDKAAAGVVTPPAPRELHHTVPGLDSQLLQPGEQGTSNSSSGSSPDAGSPPGRASLHEASPSRGSVAKLSPRLSPGPSPLGMKPPADAALETLPPVTGANLVATS